MASRQAGANCELLMRFEELCAVSSRGEESVTSIYSDIFPSLIPLKELFSVVHNQAYNDRRLLHCD